MKSLGLGIAGLSVIVFLQASTFAITPLSDPASVTCAKLTNAIPVTSNNYGAACALSDNFALIGVPGRNNSAGGYDLYRKTPAMTWKRVESRSYDQEVARFGSSVAIDDAVMFIGGNERSSGGLLGVGSVMVRAKDSQGVWQDQEELFASQPGEYDGFGFALAVDGNVLAVAAPGVSNSMGCVYLFNYASGSWNQGAVVYPADGGENDEFGVSVALKDNYLAVGASGSDGSVGAVYLYELVASQWQPKKKFTPANPSDHYFGESVAMDSDWLFVGCSAVVDGKDLAGNVTVYDMTKNDVPQVALLTSANQQANANFGNAIGLDGNLAVIGAFNFDGVQSDSGQATIFQYDGEQWNRIRELPFYPAGNSSYFGYSIAVRRNHVFCGAPGLDNAETNVAAGAVFMYDLNQSWMTAGHNAHDWLGFRVGISQTHMAVSAPNENYEELDSAGMVYIYRRHGSQWTNECVLTEPESVRTNANDFGRGMALCRNYLIVSAPYRSANYDKDGAVYIYKRSETSWENVYTQTGPGNYSLLGSSVAIDHPFALATCSNDATSESWVDVYRCDSQGAWSKHSEIHPPVTYPGAIGFGNDIAIDGNLVAVGADNYKGGDGAAFVYHWTGELWENIGTEVGESDGKFGQGVAVSGNMIAIGSPGVDLKKGAISLYSTDNSTLALITNIAAPANCAAGDLFGYSVAFAGNGRTLIGGSYKKHLGSIADVGATHAYRYDFSTGAWNYDGTTYPPDNGSLNPYSWFGRDLAAFCDTVVAGMYRYDGGGGMFSGGVAVYEMEPHVAPADFDGDAITDIGCYYAPSGFWYVLKSASRELWTTAFGYSDTTPYVDDFDGDWITDFGCFDSVNGYWFTYGSARGFWVEKFGSLGSIRITGDFDGDSLADPGYFDAANSTFHIMCSATGYKSASFGTVNGYPVAGDFDGDGIDDFGTYYAPSGQWDIKCSRTGEWSTKFGYDGTTPITGDFDGDGIIDFGCYYPPSGAWYIYKSRDGFWVNNFGYSGTLPVTGDFDGDGIEDFGCYYPPSGTWYVYKSTEKFWVNNFGYSGTVPMN